MIRLFRYHGIESCAVAIAGFLKAQSPTAQHPIQMAKGTGLALFDVQKTLRRCDDLFILLPKKAGEISRYRLATAIQGLDNRAVAALIKRRARSDRLWLQILTVNIAALVLLLLFVYTYQA